MRLEVALRFSSPEPKAQVSYCHSVPSVVRPSVNVNTFMFLSSGMHIFKHFYLLTLASRGLLPIVFGVKCKSCCAGTSIC